MQKRILYIAFLLLAICNKIVGANGVDQITISNFSIYSGQSKEIAVELTNTESYVGFQFDLSLPQGVTVDSCWADSKRIPAGTSLRMAQQTDGSYRFVAAALDGTAITGNSGAVVNITVKAGDNLTEGSYTGYIRDIKLSKADGSGTTIAEQPFTITVKGNEAYAALSENNTVLTFYYDKKKEERNGMDIGPFTSSQDRGWYSTAANITTVVFDASFDAYRPTSTAYWFDDSFKLETITDIKYLHTDEVTSMGNMFAGCERLSSINLSGFNTEKVTNMSLMFFSCSRLTAINVSGFNTASVTNMEGLFSGCSGLTDINVGNFNTAGVTNMNNMFNDCTGLTKLDLSSFNTRNVTWMQWTFNGLTNLKTIYVGDGWTNANVTRSEEMFTGSTALVGGQGTVYDANHVDADYAHIDGGTANPGYFTPKNGYGQAATPTFTHDGNLVFAHSTTEGATIRYTIDGEAPTETTGLVYSDSIVVTRNCTIRAIAIRENFTPSEVAEYNVNWFKVANVEFTQNGHTITLSTPTGGATIHYTLSNSVAGEQIYTAPLTLDADCTVEAYATRAGWLNSDTTSFVFHADGVTCSNPIFARNGNVITISTQTENAQIYYTTDGMDPTAQSQLYADSIVVDRNMTIKAIAMRENYYPSQVTTFVVDWFKVETPTMVWDADTLIVSSATEGSLIEAIYRQTSDGDVLAWASGVNPMVIHLENLYYEIWAAKEGWKDSDTLKFYYPYTAWHELLIAVNEANAAIQQATGNDNVPTQMLNDLKTLTEEAQAMYSQRTAEEAAIQDQTSRLRELTDAVLQLANAEAEPYAVLTGDTISGMTLTFYYDKKKQERNGMSVGPFTVWTERGWNDNRTDITTVVFDSTFVNYRPTSTAYWFYLGQNITSINGMQYLNTSEVTDMAYMFGYCRQLASLDLSNFNTEKVTDMNTMFLNCSTLADLDVSTFNTEKVTDMSTMFYGCSGLTRLDLSNFKTENVTNMSGMFQECSGLTSLNISSFNTSKANINQMFTACSSLTSLDLRNLDISATPALSFLFSECSSLKTLDLTTFNTSNVTHFMGMFQECTSLTDVNLSNFNTENGVNMAQMFYGCSSLERIDLSSFNTSKVTSFGLMFYDCKNLRTIYVGDGWTTSKIDQEEYSRKDVFLGCSNLVGGMGTAYDSLHVDYTYAHIDGGPDNPGYFTDINGPSQKVATPTFAWNDDMLTISTTTTDAAIRFTMSDIGNGRDTLNYSAPIEVKRDVFISAWAEHMGMITSDTISLDYPYEAWRELLVTIQECTVVAAQCEGSSKVDQTAVQSLRAQCVVANEMYRERVASRDAILSRSAELRIFAAELLRQLNAIDYAFDSSNGVLTVGGSTTLADALSAAGGRDEVAKRITAIVWNSTATLTNSDLQGLDNPNMLIYVKSDSLAPVNRDNVVVNGFAKNIVLTDVESGNNNFYCPQAFTAEMISYTRNFQQQTQIGVSRGWESIALPFAVQTIMHEKNGVIAPFGNDASSKHFWLRQLTQQGVAQATAIQANTPYLISMPNSIDYPDEFNQAGRVTFSSQDVLVPVTSTNTVVMRDSAANTTVAFYPAMQRVGQAESVYALNVGSTWQEYAEGSVFVAGLRDIRPFEAYTVHNSNSPAPRYIPVSQLDNGSTGIDELRFDSKVAERWYDLNGRKLQQKPTRKGLYILNGKTVVVK